MSALRIYSCTPSFIWGPENQKQMVSTWRGGGEGEGGEEEEEEKEDMHTLPYHTISDHTIPYHTIPYYTIPYHPYHTIRYHTIPYHTITYVDTTPIHTWCGVVHTKTNCMFQKNVHLVIVSQLSRFNYACIDWERKMSNFWIKHTIPPCTNVLRLYSSYVRDFFGSCSGTNACMGLPVYAPGVVYRLTLCMLMNCILKHIISTQAYFSIYFSIYIPGW